MTDVFEPAETGVRMAERVRRGIIGEGTVLDGPYGPRRLTYADYTASGRALDFVEDAIRGQVLTYYGNTHTDASATGARTTHLREEARRTVHRAVGGTEDDVVIFCGSGVTAAVDKLVALLGLRRAGRAVRKPATGEAATGEAAAGDGGAATADSAARGRVTREATSPATPAATSYEANAPVDGGDGRPVVFVGPYEHHSNELPWRESAADVVVIGERADGHIDVADLRDQLVKHADRPLLIGSFSAASNVTGIRSDTSAIAALLHEHGALSIWDYAAAGPYLPIRMAATEPGGGDYKDAVVLSPHKFPGGPQTPGVLVVRRELIPAVPSAPGGGTVAYVDPAGHRYLDDPIAREEAGTPAIVESIRAGLVFAVKEAVGTATIGAREHRLGRRLLDRWEADPRIRLLGRPDGEGLPIMSFQVACGGHFLHHNFVVALLNDLFGVQARGGCSCAGPYGHRLLGIDPQRSRVFEDLIDAGWEGVKPGWARLGLNYFFTDMVTDFLADAVLFIARYGPRFLPDYRFDPRTGLWRHERATAPPGLTLTPPGDSPTWGEEMLAHQLQQAYELAARRPEPVDGGPTGLPAPFDAARWFPLPTACLH